MTAATQTYVLLTDVTPNRGSVCRVVVVDAAGFLPPVGSGLRVALWTGEEEPEVQQRCYHRGADFQTAETPTAWG